MMNLIKRLNFKFWSLFFHAVTVTLGRLRMPWSKKMTSYADVDHLLRILDRGDVIHTRTLGELSSLLIPGYWKHSAIYIGDGRVVHATKEGVHISWLADLIMKTDYYVATRIRNSEVQRKNVADEAVLFIGKPYDTFQEFNNPDKFSCSELVRTATNKAFAHNIILIHNRMGYPTLTPTDIYDMKYRYNILIERRGY